MSGEGCVENVEVVKDVARMWRSSRTYRGWDVKGVEDVEDVPNGT